MHASPVSSSSTPWMHAERDGAEQLREPRPRGEGRVGAEHERGHGPRPRRARPRDRTRPSRSPRGVSSTGAMYSTVEPTLPRCALIACASACTDAGWSDPGTTRPAPRRRPRSAAAAETKRRSGSASAGARTPGTPAAAARARATPSTSAALSGDPVIGGGAGEGHRALDRVEAAEAVRPGVGPPRLRREVARVPHAGERAREEVGVEADTRLLSKW